MLGERGRCTHYVPLKRRHCAWPALPGQTLCGNHARDDERIPCPLDARHSVVAAELAQHLRVCNATRDAARAASAPHLRPGLNGGGDSTSDDEDGEAAEAEALALWQCREGDARAEEARAAVRAAAALVLASAAATAPLPPPASEPACVSAALAALAAAAAAPHATTPSQPRHAAQQAGILAHMAAEGLLPPPDGGVIFAELGCGRGYLSHLLAEAYVRGSSEASLLLVERRSYRCKAERSLRGVAVTRLKCDLADLDLSLSPLPAEAQAAAPPRRRRLVAIAKHLCGGGTDAALRCAARCSRTALTDGGPVLLGLAIAPCCHHACRWRVFCGKRALRRCGIGPLQFALVSRMASWAVCPGATPSDDDSHPAPSTTTDARWGLSAAERYQVGAASKQLLDAARTEWATLRCGGAGRLVSYCAAQVSPEHRLIVMRADV